MGAMPGWVVSGGHKCLPFRFAYAAHSAFSSNLRGGCRGNSEGKLKNFEITFLEYDDDNLVVRSRHNFSSVSSLGMSNPRPRRSSPPSPSHHRREKQPHHVLKTPSPYCPVIQFRRSVDCCFFSSPNTVKVPRGLQSSRVVRPRSGAIAKSSRGAGGGSEDDMLRAGDLKYIEWWEQRMGECQKPSTRELIKRLVSNNILGLDTNLKHGKMKQGGFTHELLELKRRFPHEVILRRVGEFYESSGYDACVLAEYAGLNPMGGLTNSSSVPRAGCPIENLRQTLDALTRNGFSVCIVEEVKGPTNARGRKERFISGHAHPGSPYVYGLAEADFDVDFPDPVSIIGISRSASGYCIISVMELMRCVSIQNQLTEEAVVAKLRAMPVQRLFLHRSLRDQSTETVRWGEFGEGGLLWAECRGQNSEWYEFDPVSELLCKVREIYDLDPDTEFRRIVSHPGQRPRPLSVGTASQVGILPTHGVPSLLRVLFPPDMHGLCVAYLRDLLLNPPPFRVAACLKKAMRIMLDFERPIPDFQCVSAAKIVKLIGAKEANHLEFARIKNMAEDVLLMEKDAELAVCLGLFLDPTWLATGLRLEREQLVRDCSFLVKRLGEVLAPAGDPCNAVSKRKYVPDEFFNDMEIRWRARVRREHAEKGYSEVERDASTLADAIEADFYPIVLRTKGLASPMGGGGGTAGGAASGEICYSSSNRAVWFKGKRFRPTLFSGGPGEEEIKALEDAKDSKGKKMGEDWFTTDRVENALECYRSAVERASNAVTAVLKSVAEELQSKLNTIVFLATVSIIAKATFGHVSEAKRRRWVLPSLCEGEEQEQEQEQEQKQEQEQEKGRIGNENAFDFKKKQKEDASPSIHLKDMFPYWLDKTQDRVVLNTVQLDSMFLLTGPNGGGKSSVLRSICAATLLATCGLMVPASKAVVPRLDSIMLRMMIGDSPADCKSSFQMEMSELRTILSEATEKSLVLVDELCKGTEVNKGTFIVASVLEHLDHLGCLGVISTHLHGLLDIDLDVQRVVHKAMGVELVGGQPRPTWKLVDGVCRESLAFETARKEGVPENVLRRAEELYQGSRNAGKEHTGTNGRYAIGHGGGSAKALSLVEEDVEGSLRTGPPSSADDSESGYSEVNFVSGGEGRQTAEYENSFSRPTIYETLTSRETLFTESENLHSMGNNPSPFPLGEEGDVPLKAEIMRTTEESYDLEDLQHLFLRICRKKLSELSGIERSCQCFVVGPRQKPPPMITNRACVYVLMRPDGKLYVGQTNHLSARMERHRAAPGLHEASFLYAPLHSASVSTELETCLIKQLPYYGFSVVNKGDQNHKYFGTAPLVLTGGDDDPPF